jgi:hypothetical protein
MTTAQITERLRGHRPSEAEFVENARRGVAGILTAIGIVTMAALVSSTDVVTNTAYTYALMGAVLILAVTTLALRITPYSSLIAVYVGSAIASAWLSIPTAASGEFPLTAQWLLHSCAIAGFLLPTKRAILVIFPTATIILITMCARLEPGRDWSDTAAILIIVVDAIGISMGINAGLTTWRRYALRRDAAVDTALDASSAAERAEQRVRGRYLLRIHLHDTVLNFFRSLRNSPPGAPLDSPLADEGVRQRAADCLEQLDSSTFGRSAELMDASRIVVFANDEAHAFGLHATVEFDSTSYPPTVIPARVFFGIQACIRAALLNTHSHSEAANVTIRITDVDGEVRVSVVDDGKGFTVGSVGPLSIERRGAHFGVDTRVTSRASHGTRVDIGWPSAEPHRSEPTDSSEYDELMNGSLAVLAFRIAAWLAGAFLLEAILLPDIRLLSPAMVGLLIFIPVVVASVARSRPWPIPWIATLGICLAIPIVMTLVKSTSGICTSEAETFIGSSLAMIMAAVAMMLARRTLQALVPYAVYAAAAGVVALLALSESADCGSAVFANYVTDIASLAALFIVRQSFIRFTDDLQISREIELESVEAELLAANRASQVTGRLMTALAASRSIVAQLHDGRLDPADPNVRHQVNVEERLLRNLLTIDSEEIGSLAAPMRDLAALAHERGTNLHFGVAAAPWRSGMEPSTEVADAVAQLLTALFVHMPIAAESRITVLPGQAVPVRVVIPATGLIPLGDVSSELSVESFYDDGQFDIELRWAAITSEIGAEVDVG